MKQQHSADILFLEFVRIFLWFNPFFHLIKKEIKAIHEFPADQYAVSDNNQYDYAELLILESINAKKTAISNYFFQNHIKRRIVMITQFKTKKYNYWTRLMVLPLSILLFCAIALYARNPKTTFIKKENPPSVSQSLPELITVLVDAGHGGKDLGAQSDNGLLEKNIALTIARQLKKHGAAYNINIAMTRDEDIYSTLKERSEMANAVKADMIISVHVAAMEKIKNDKSYNPNPANGFNIYITNRNQQTVEQSKLLGLEIAKQINSIYTVGAIKQRNEKGIWILDAVTCPAVLIECGYLTNDKDLAFISKAENQEKIAKSILEGIGDYQSGEKIKKTADTIPVAKRGKDSMNLQMNDIQLDPEHQLKIADIQSRQIRNRQQLLIQKQYEMELAQHKMQEASAEMQNKQRLLIQKQHETELAHRKMQEASIAEMQNKQRLLIQKQHEMELAHRKMQEASVSEMQNKKRLLIQKQHEMELVQHKMQEARVSIMQNKQRLLIQKQEEMELAQRKMQEEQLKNSALPEKQKTNHKVRKTQPKQKANQ